MAILVSNIRIDRRDSQEKAYEKALKKLGVSKEQTERIYLAKTSVDARRKPSISLVCSVGVELKNGGEEQLVAKLADSAVSVRRPPELVCRFGTQKLSSRPVIAGFGPAGMFAALVLARNGYAPLVLERGGDVDSRVKAVESFWQGKGLNLCTNVQFGEGGAGTFSDGKLTTRINDSRCEWVLRELAGHGAPQEILQKAKPHIGTDQLRKVVRSIREEICHLGGEIWFETCLQDLRLHSGRVWSLRTDREEIPAAAVILSIGHSARDTFAMLAERGLSMESKPFSVGVRAEHLQKEIDRGLYGGTAEELGLPAGEYQLSHRRQSEAVYTFCMCPGGMVVPSSSEEGGVVTNGMSEFARNRLNANSAVVVSVDSRDFGRGILDGIEFQRQLEQAAFGAGGGGYRAPAQDLAGFLESRSSLKIGRVLPSYALGVEKTDLQKLFSPRIAGLLREGFTVFPKKIPGFGAKDTILTGVETRTSSPVRILRGESLEALGIEGLYPCGEGAGYAGGIMSAAVDGVRVAQALMEKYCQPKD